MKNILKIVGIVLLALLLIFIVYKISIYKEPSFKKFDFKSYHCTMNKTKITFLDSIVHAGLQTLNIDTVYVMIKELKNGIDMLPDDLEAKAYIIGNNQQYIIYIQKGGRYDDINYIAHEMIHLKQYYNKELILVDDETVIWHNIVTKVSDYPYNERPWEKEAFDNQNDVAKKMKEILY